MLAKAKLVVAGFSKVENAIKQGNAGILIHAADGAADGIRKLNGAARAAHATEFAENPPQMPDIIDVLTSAELDLALGRTNVIHAALPAGPASTTFLSRCRGLGQFRATAPGKTASKNSVSKTRADAPGQD
jgi:hypothetical protein